MASVKRPAPRRTSSAQVDIGRILHHWRDVVPNDRMAHLVKDPMRALVRALQMRLAEHDVSFGHWTFLRILWESDGLTQRELSREAGVMEPTTFAALKAMEARGYVVRPLTADLMDERFERPADFDLPAYWTEWSDHFQKSLPRYPVTLRVSPEFIPVLPRVFGEGMHSQIDRAGPPAQDGSITLTLTFESLEAACGPVLALGTGAEILSPQELRDAVLDLAAHVVALYASAAD